MSPPPWPDVRAALLAVVLVAHGLVALPIGPRITEKSLTDPRAQDEVAAWMRLAGPLGFTKASFEQTLIVWSDRLVTADATITAPFKPVMHATRTGQGWALFANPDVDPLRFEVRGTFEDGSTRLLFARLDPDATWMSDVFAFRRVRGVYDLGGKGQPPRYVNLCRWVADRAFDDFPDLAKVEIVQVEHRTNLPWQPPFPDTAERYKQVIRRSDR